MLHIYNFIKYRCMLSMLPTDIVLMLFLLLYRSFVFFFFSFLWFKDNAGSSIQFSVFVCRVSLTFRICAHYSFPMSCAWAIFLTCLQRICFGTEYANIKSLNFHRRLNVSGQSHIVLHCVFAFIIQTLNLRTAKVTQCLWFLPLCRRTAWMIHEMCNLLFACQWLLFAIKYSN